MHEGTASPIESYRVASTSLLAMSVHHKIIVGIDYGTTFSGKYLSSTPLKGRLQSPS
jgi:hypothetical protein